MPDTPRLLTRAALAADLARLGVAPGDLVMVHAACRRVGPVLGGPDAVVGALRDAVGPDGTVMAYLDWDAPWEELAGDDGRVPEAWKPHVPPFDPALVGDAPSVLVDAADVLPFAVAWLERAAG